MGTIIMKPLEVTIGILMTNVNVILRIIGMIITTISNLIIKEQLYSNNTTSDFLPSNTNANSTASDV